MRARYAVLVLAGVLVGCAIRCSSQTLPGDSAITDSDAGAARDGRVTPHPTDAARPDQATDIYVAESGVVDAPNAAEDNPFPFPGTWNVIPGAPVGCDTRVAQDPAASVSAFKWEACAGGRQGCAQYTADWNPGSTELLLQADNERDPVILDGVPYFRFVRRFYAGNSQRRYATVVQPMEGPALFAVSYNGKSPVSCSASSGFGPDGAALINTALTSPKQSWLTLTTWDRVADLKVIRLGDSELGGISVQLLPAHNRVFATVDYNMDQSTVAIDPSVGRIYSPNDSRHFYYTTMPKVVKDGILLYGNVPMSGVYFMDPNGSARRVVKPQPGHYVISFGVDHASNDSIVWMEAKDGDGLDLIDFSLWMSAYATSESQLQRRKVAAFADGTIYGQFVVNHGLVLLLARGNEGRLLKLADGRSWGIRSDTERVLGLPVWVDEQCSWFVTSKSEGSSSDGLIRIDRSTLGEPTIPSGL